MGIAMGLQMACGPLRSGAQQRKGEDLVVLLPEADGSMGHATVSTPAGEVDLTTERAYTRTRAGQAPEPVKQMSQDDVERIFGPALAAQPPAPVHFTLFFRFDSEELTVESRALVADVLNVVKSHPVPRITVIGHTDTTGSAASNIDLGLRRANVVRLLLIDAGLDANALDVTSHGEATLLVPTADEVFEPKNRRVEISVR